MDKKIKVWFNRYKKYIAIILIVLVLILLIFIIGKTLADPNTGYLRNQTVSGLSFEDANITYDNGVTTFTAKVYNESGSNYLLKNISINLKDKDNNVTTLIGYIGDELVQDEGKLITASIDDDLTDSVSLEYVINN